MFSIVVSVLAMAISLVSIYMSRESWYYTVHGLVIRKGQTGAAEYLVDVLGWSRTKADKNVRTAVLKHGV